MIFDYFYVVVYNKWVIFLILLSKSVLIWFLFLFYLKVVLHEILHISAKACNFTKSNTPQRVFFLFSKLYKWYQIRQNITFIKAAARGLLKCFRNLWRVNCNANFVEVDSATDIFQLVVRNFWNFFEFLEKSHIRIYSA